MNIAGIICEYNPFHNGHAYQIRRTREVSQCDAVVCVMSGSMVQRGEVAICDKWTRARWALEHGADLVVELPTYYVLQSADVFARGGVSMLQHLGATHVSFGSESGDISYLSRLTELMCSEDDAFRKVLSDALAGGMGYPAAYAYALKHTDAVFDTPPGANDLLGAAYLRAVGELGADISPIVIDRRGVAHDAPDSTDTFASASAIREMLLGGAPVDAYVPWHGTAECRDTERLQSLILGFFRSATPNQLDDVPGMEDGLGNRLIAAAREAGTLEQFRDLAVTRRYTKSRVRRTAFCALLGIRKDMVQDCIRVLGFTPKGAQIIKSAKAHCTLPIVVKMADFTPQPNGMTAADLRATDLAALCEPNPQNRRAGADFTVSPIKKGF